MRAAALLPLLIACSPAAMQRGLRITAVATEVLAQGSLACDAGSTRSAVQLGGQEQNLVMGTHPDGSVITAYFVGSGVGVAAYNRVLPDILRVAINVLVIGGELAAASGNSSANPRVGMCGL